MEDRKILHVDVNNAFLSWTAVDLLRNGYEIDIRTIPAIIGGDEERRSGIVLAKSPVAKKFGVVTVCSDPMYFPCIFDKVKPYKGQIIQVFIGEEDYYMDRFGQVYTKEFMEIRNL